MRTDAHASIGTRVGLRFGTYKSTHISIYAHAILPVEFVKIIFSRLVDRGELRLQGIVGIILLFYSGNVSLWNRKTNKMC